MVMFRDDWVKFGFGMDGRPSNVFTIDYSAATPHPSLAHPLDIARDVCWRLYDEHGEMTVMLSGGVDSQAVAFAFKMAGTPVRFLRGRYNGGLNDHDIHSSDAFYDAHRIEIEDVEVDILGFHDNELLDWGKRYSCSSPHILCHMKLASIARGPVVFSGCVVSPDGIVGGLGYQTFGLERYARLSGQPVIGYFLTHDSHLHYAMGRVPAALDASLPVYERKCRIYQESGFPVMPQPEKFHGFEKVKDHYDDRVISLRDRLKHKASSSSRPYDMLFRYPLLDDIDDENIFPVYTR